MVDLQRRIDHKWNTLRRWMQDDPENSDIGTSQGRDQSQKFSGMESCENFIRSDLNQMEPT